MPALNQLSLRRGSAEYQAMIEVRSPLEIQANPQGGLQLVFRVLDAFNYTAPFRTMLAEIACALGQDAETDLQLPAYEVDEDFIEGTLQFEAVPMRIYYEHCLSYLTLMSDDEPALRDVAARVQPHVALIP